MHFQYFKKLKTQNKLKTVKRTHPKLFKKINQTKSMQEKNQTELMNSISLFRLVLVNRIFTLPYILWRFPLIYSYFKKSNTQSKIKKYLLHLLSGYKSSV